MGGVRPNKDARSRPMTLGTKREARQPIDCRAGRAIAPKATNLLEPGSHFVTTH